MKAFVIKNKEGKYLYEDGYCKFGDNICWAHMEEDREVLEKLVKDCKNILGDCEVVEITIAEGDLDTYIDKLQDERDFERRDKTLIVKQLNDPNDYVIREDYIKLEQENKQLEGQHELLIDEFQKEREELCKQIKQESDARERFVEKVKQLKEQLAEKDKEIEELKTFNAKNIYDSICHALNMQEKQIRKQVCDEIKEYIAKEYGISVKDMYKRYSRLAWTVKDIYELLDQIEQAKESIK